MASAITVDQRPAHTIHPFTGFGAQLNTNLFRPATIFRDPASAAEDHPRNPDLEGQPHALTPDQHSKLSAAVANLRPGHSRVFVGRALVAAATPPSQELDALLSTLQLAEDAGANVNLTFWGQGPYAAKAKLSQLAWPEPQLLAWPAQKEQQGKLKWPPALMDGGELTGPQALMRRFANIIATVQQEGLTCVKYATIQNEPNQAPTDLAHKGNPILSMRFYERLYRLLDESLTELDIRDTVDLVAGDLVLDKQNDWIRYIHTNMDLGRPTFPSVVNGYSIHVYWEPGDGAMGFPQQLEGRLKGLAAVLGDLRIDKPVYVTEFGVRKRNQRPAPGGVGSGQAIEFSPDVAFQHGWFMALAPQFGCSGLVKWALYRTDRTSGWGEWGMIDAPNPSPGSDRTSLGRSPTYRVTRLFNHLVDHGWTADGFGKSGDGTVLVSRFKGPADESLAILNARGQPQQIAINGLRPRNYFAADWNTDRKGGPAKERPDPLTPHGNVLTVTVPARGIVALSTRRLQLS